MAISVQDKAAFETAYEAELAKLKGGEIYTADDEKLFSRVDGESRGDSIKHIVATLRAMRIVELRAQRSA